jgi:molybdate transport system ATP-binding protein
MININIQKQLQGSSGAMELNVDLHIKEHSFVALAGQSGSGKTTLLRILAGLEKAAGVIDVSGVLWQDEKKSVVPQKRNIGFVFQDPTR